MEKKNFECEFCKIKLKNRPILLRHLRKYCKVKKEMEEIQQQIVGAKKSERANPLKEVKRLCKEFGFTATMFRGALAEGCVKK